MLSLEETKIHPDASRATGIILSIAAALSIVLFVAGFNAITSSHESSVQKTSQTSD
jgi:hypothetical protein